MNECSRTKARPSCHAACKTLSECRKRICRNSTSCMIPWTYSTYVDQASWDLQLDEESGADVLRQHSKEAAVAEMAVKCSGI